MNKKILFAGVIGNLIEIYDMAIFVFLAPYIAANFFPQVDKLSALISTFAVFFVGSVARPLGSIFFGHIGDLFGRRQSLTIAIVLMAASTFAVGLLPTHLEFGIGATLLLVLCRLCQGFSVGGELTGSVIFMVEHAPQKRSGFSGSFSLAGTNMGALCAAILCGVLSSLLAANKMLAWGWRIPFLLAGFGGLVGWYVRSRVAETEIFKKTQASYERQCSPLVETMRHHWRKILLVIGIAWTGLSATYLLIAYLTTYMTSVLHYAMPQAMLIAMISLASIVLYMPIAGLLSDRFGRRSVLLFAVLGIAVLIIPYFYVVSLGSLAAVLVAQLLINIPAACYFAVGPVVMVEMMPAEVRYTASSIGYSLAAAIFGTSTPMLATWLIRSTHSIYSPAVYVTCVAMVSLCCCLLSFKYLVTPRLQMSDAG